MHQWISPSDERLRPSLSCRFKTGNTYGLELAPSLCKAPNQINTPDINFVDVRKNFVDDCRGSLGFST